MPCLSSHHGSPRPSQSDALVSLGYIVSLFGFYVAANTPTTKHSHAAYSYAFPISDLCHHLPACARASWWQAIAPARWFSTDCLTQVPSHLPAKQVCVHTHVSGYLFSFLFSHLRVAVGNPLDVWVQSHGSLCKFCCTDIWLIMEMSTCQEHFSCQVDMPLVSRCLHSTVARV